LFAVYEETFEKPSDISESNGLAGLKPKSTVVVFGAYPCVSALFLEFFDKSEPI
jgi:hypothetical protein